MTDQTVQISYVDRPDVSEVFADFTDKISFDGQVWRLDFCITRMDEPNPTTITGKRYPVCRLALSPNAGIDLANKLKAIMEMLEKQGLIKQVPLANIVQPPNTKPN